MVKGNKGKQKGEYLPCSLVNEFNIQFANVRNFRTKNNFLLCIGIVFAHQLENGGSNIYVPLGAAYWKKVFGGNYSDKVLKPLLGTNIIQSKRFISPGEVKKRYRINPSLADDTQFEWISYTKPEKDFYSAEEMILSESDNLKMRHTSKQPRLFVGIDKEKTIDWVENNIDRIVKVQLNDEFIGDLPGKLVIHYKEYLNDGTFTSHYGTVDSARQHAHNSGKELFFWRKAFYVADKELFIEFRKKGHRYLLLREINKITSVPIVNIRSKNTNRIYNNLVTFPGDILQFLTLNRRRIVEYDLKTSQFRIFANILNIYLRHGSEDLLNRFKLKNNKEYLNRLVEILDSYRASLPAYGVSIDNPEFSESDSNDVIRFIHDVFYRDFYSVIQKELNLGNRAIVKLMMFTLLFRRVNRVDPLTEKLNKLYPTVMKIIATFKKDAETIKQHDSEIDEKQQSNFSLFLQSIEGEIFIDNILYPCWKEKIPCFSRHDSILVAKGHEHQVVKLINETFRHFDFQYDMKMSDYTEDYLELVGFEDYFYSGGDAHLLPEPEINPLGYYFNCLVLSDHDFEIIQNLLDIGIKSDYTNEGIDLYELVELPFLTSDDKEILFEQIDLGTHGNGYSLDMNDLIRRIIRFCEKLNYPKYFTGI
jgi:hypothetical protein